MEPSRRPQKSLVDNIVDFMLLSVKCVVDISGQVRKYVVGQGWGNAR